MQFSDDVASRAVMVHAEGGACHGDFGRSLAEVVRAERPISCIACPRSISPPQITPADTRDSPYRPQTEFSERTTIFFSTRELFEYSSVRGYPERDAANGEA